MSPEDMREWPRALRMIAEVIGPELALELARKAGGIDDVHIPREPTPTHPWAQALGHEHFAALCRALGGQSLNVPRGAFVAWKTREIIELAEQGFTTRQIALRCGVTARHVRRTLQGLSLPPRVDPRQRRLFDF